MENDTRILINEAHKFLSELFKGVPVEYVLGTLFEEEGKVKILTVCNLQEANLALAEALLDTATNPEEDM